MQTQARLVIVGAGVVGCSIAYHLTKLGWRDIVVVDKGPLYETGGSSSHAPGLIFQTNYAKFMTQCAMYSVNLFKELTYNDTPCAYQVGGIEVAYTDARLRELHRKQSAAAAYGLDAHVISAREVADRVPILDPGVIKGGYYVPTDTDVRGWYCAAALAERAIASGGAHFYGHINVSDIEVVDGRCTGVLTDQGRIGAEQVLLATNVWASVLPAKIGLRFPILGVEHQYVITEPLAELAADKDLYVKHPIVRHQDFSGYYRQHGDAYGIGNYRHKSMLFEGGYVGAKAERAFTPEDFEVAKQAAEELFPPLRGKKYTRQFNGFMAFSTDMGPIMGETDIPGLDVCLGVWVTHSGGVGKTMAEWMDSRTTEFAMHEAWTRRFQPHETTKTWMYARVDRQYQEVYDIIHPLQQMENPRNVRVAPFHQRLVEQGAHFHAVAGWEAAHWYEKNAHLLAEYDERIPHRRGWEAMNWSRMQGAEHLATRDKAALYNIANFAKFEVRGPGALPFLEYMAANRIDRPVGTMVYTALCTASGGIKADLTITRTGPESFLILTGGGTGPADLAWLRMHAPTDGSVVIEDSTSKYTGVALWGPKARAVLESVCAEDVSNAAFPYFTAKTLSIDTVPAFAGRLSYAGELGWEIYCLSEYGLRLWDVLWEAGQPHGIFALGSGAFNSLRGEKGYRAVGLDLTTEYNPFEAGIGWAVRLQKGDFLGREALIAAKEAGVKRQLCCLTSDDPSAMALGKEPVFADGAGNNSGRAIGYLTSVDYGYSIGKLVAYAYLPIAYAEKGTQVEVQYFDQRFKAVVADDPQFDVEMRRLKS
ncbi:MAG: FAD-dependent oxidoreductase [Caldilineaceae bacterium]|nr:FAD-dependent oxidoreductase [Caldilineaceae bacterium]